MALSGTEDTCGKNNEVMKHNNRRQRVGPTEGRGDNMQEVRTGCKREEVARKARLEGKQRRRST